MGGCGGVGGWGGGNSIIMTSKDNIDHQTNILVLYIIVP